jgi:TRAP-type C4-dicarboxylate transport system permease small subunit
MVHQNNTPWLAKRLYSFVKFLDCLSWVTLFAMMTITISDVFLRKFTNTSILGTVELTEFMMVIVVFCSLAQCEADNGHIRVELIMNKFGPKARTFADIFTQILCTVLFALMSTSIYHHGINMKSSGEVTMDLGLPVYPFVYIALTGCIVMTVVLLSKTIVIISKAIKS